MQLHPEVQEKALFYPIGTEKFVELSLATFGLYNLYWSWANWRQISQPNAFMPWFKLLIWPISQWQLYQRIYRQAVEDGEQPRWQPLRAYLLFILSLLFSIWFVASGDSHGWFLALLATLPNAQANLTVNRLHDSRLHFYAQNTDLTALEWGILVVGMVAWVSLMALALSH
ncbi:hypothetical protein CHH28_15860 [Bacterioplanes sanyensis]|uniref:DUF4234 domain-containing protein n=1 Tax=Bacterioplanes sanyensis TaxID=1249553 RepID=A0A222FM21_9GAMM|nr:hypothetical protein [Bacterioplanes sanyensis]ASP40058.1 hypothetical protein CHH28_15860 [Bacterioplanes sanyensis]